MDTNSELEVRHESQRKRSSNVKEVAELVDIISQLPDHLITKVLSFLDTKEAIRTCVLSSRWKNLWNGINCIRLNGRRTDPENFSNLVEHVLKNCSSRDFLVFELFCPLSVDLTRLNAWIGRIIDCKIERLILNANNSDGFECPEPPLPQFILSCTTLVYLELDCFDIQIPESVFCFPCLKELDFHVVFPDNVVGVNQLLSSCPVLEKLHMFGYVDLENDSHEGHDGMKINVSVASLKRLSLDLKGVSYMKQWKHGVIIDTPNLEYLEIVDDSTTKYMVKNLPLVSNVCVNYQAIVYDMIPKCINHILEFLEGIVVTELLTLQWYTIDVLGSALSYTWPTFPYLTTLIVHLFGDSCWACFSKLLHNAPILNYLVLDLDWINDIYDDDNKPSYQCTHPDTVPKCLLEHLETIVIQKFEGNVDEIQAVEYLLNNAQVLECIMIGYESDRRSEEVIQKLLMAPRASKNCEVEIYERLEFENNIRTSLLNHEVYIWGSGPIIL